MHFHRLTRRWWRSRLRFGKPLQMGIQRQESLAPGLEATRLDAVIILELEHAIVRRLVPGGARGKRHRARRPVHSVQSLLEGGHRLCISGNWSRRVLLKRRVVVEGDV